MNRYKASAYHFVGSAAVLFLVFALVRWVWYPGPLFVAAHGINLLGIIVPVDVIIGPLITLIIFNTAKKGLKRDMAIIFVAQVAFMLYGVFTIYSARPVYLALVEQDFHMVTANQVDPDDQKKAKDPQFQKMPFFGPEWVGVTVADKSVADDLAFSNALSGLGSQNMPQYFTPLEKNLARVKESARTADKLVGVTPQEQERLKSYAKEHSSENIRFVRIYAKTKQMFAVVDSSSGKVKEVI